MDLHDDKSVSIEIKRMRIALIPTVVFLSFLWLFLFLDITLDLQLYKLGVYPLKTEGLPGILSLHSFIVQ